MVRAGALSQVSEVSDRTHVVQAVLFEESEPRRVVTAVLQALETLEKEGLALTRADVSDDPAHALSLLSPPRLSNTQTRVHPEGATVPKNT